MHRLLSDAAVTRSTGRDEASSGGLDPPLARRSVVAGADNVGDGTVLRAINCYRDLQRRSDSATAVLVTVQTSIFKLFRAFVIIRLDWTYHAHQFILVFLLQLLFVPWYTKLLSWLPVSLLLHVKYTAP